MIRRALILGISMIEIMIVVAISASLALVGVPAYKRYVIKAKVAVILDLATAMKLRIESDYLEDGVTIANLTAENTDSGAGNLYIGSDYWGESDYNQISSVTVNSGVIVINGDKTELGLLTSDPDFILTFTPTFIDNAKLDSWTCTINDAGNNDLVTQDCRI